ncbi:hypothetical protein HY486_00280, partial [Candidatus Woesearchaeota archaeon]|nr:hypothetical protein [Candidatus Woesearchaeota archaeon]
MKTWLVTLAEKGTFFVIDNRIYLTGAQAANDKYLQLGEERIELVPAGTVEEIIVFHDSIQKAEIYEQQKAFIQEKTKLTLETADVRKQDMLQRKTLQFIIKELMPHMSGHKEDLTEMLGEAARKQTMPTTVNAQELDEAIRQTKERLYKEQTDYARRHDIDDNEANYLRKQLSGGILVHRKGAYMLTQSKRDGIIICTHKPRRYLLEQTGIDNIEEQYVKYRQWRIKTQAIEALTEHIAEKQKIALATLKDFEKILQLKEFNEGDVGFLQEKEGIYVYQ